MEEKDLNQGLQDTQPGNSLVPITDNGHAHVPCRAVLIGKSQTIDLYTGNTETPSRENMDNESSYEGWSIGIPVLQGQRIDQYCKGARIDGGSAPSAGDIFFIY